MRGDAIDEDRALARELAEQRRELADRPGRRPRRVDPQPHRRASTATDSKAEISWAISFVSPSLWSTRPLTITIRSGEQSSRGRGVGGRKDDAVDPAGDVVEAQEDHLLAALGRRAA